MAAVNVNGPLFLRLLAIDVFQNVAPGVSSGSRTMMTVSDLSVFLYVGSRQTPMRWRPTQLLMINTNHLGGVTWEVG